MTSPDMQGTKVPSTLAAPSQMDSSVKEGAAQDIEKASSRSRTTAEENTTQEKKQPEVIMDDEPVHDALADLVDWDGDSDPHKPMNWTAPRKIKNIIVICYLTFLTSVMPKKLQCRLFENID